MPGFIHRLFGRDDLDVDCLQDGRPDKLIILVVPIIFKGQICGAKDQARAGILDQSLLG